MDYLKLCVDKLSVDAVSELVVDESCGAVSMFVGTTRNNFEGKKVVRLEYEAYEPMALKSMTDICREIRSKWPSVHGIAIYHRLGEVPVREASVIIAISSPHRQDSLQAVSFCIDALKAKVPIWKKEVYADDEPIWKENRECSSQPPPPPAQPSEDLEPPTQPSEDLEPPPPAAVKSEYDKSLVQINVSNEELQRRIQSFIERKREQINKNNIQDFIPSMQKRDGATADPNGEEGEEDSCARVRTQFVRRKDSKSHLKMRKVNNEWGPQLARAPLKRESESKPDLTLPSGIAERVLELERSLSLAPLGKDVYRRLKDAEDRLAELQGMSPEYAGFWNDQCPLGNTIKQEQSVDVLFTAEDIARKIEMLEGSGTL